MIDTHAHIYLDSFAEDRYEMIERAKDVGVKRVYLPNIDGDSLQDVIQLSETYPGFCYPMAGIHPCSVKEDFSQQLAAIYKHLQDHKYVGVGEIGLDYYWDKTFIPQQKETFRIQITWAKEMNLPFVIHSRDSLDDSIEIVTELQDGNLRGIFHCFNGTEEQGQRIMDIGFLLGIGGVVTFKNAGVDKTVAHLPLDAMVLETDAPYLTPAPYRGKRNEPSYLQYIVEKMAEVKEISVKEVIDTTSRNAIELFGR